MARRMGGNRPHGSFPLVKRVSVPESWLSQCHNGAVGACRLTAGARAATPPALAAIGTTRVGLTAITTPGPWHGPARGIHAWSEFAAGTRSRNSARLSRPRIHLAQFREPVPGHRWCVSGRTGPRPPRPRRSADPRNGDRRHLREQGLIETVRIPGYREQAVVLTDRGRDLLEVNRDRDRDTGQAFWAGLKRERELEHDTPTGLPGLSSNTPFTGAGRATPSPGYEPRAWRANRLGQSRRCG